MWKADREMERLFRDQFRHENGRLVFRRNSKAAPVPVTEEEREAAVALFLRRYRLSMVLFVAGTIVLVFALALVGDGHLLERSGTTWLVCLALVGVILLVFRWSWHGSVERFTRRTPVGSERSRAEIRAELLASWSWGRILSFILFGLVIAGPRIFSWPPSTIDEWIWFALGTFLVLGGLFNCFKKWQLQPRGGAASP